MNTIFVSSTFRDMHFERDAIQELVLPRLSQKARSYGQSISFCDLRWGIDTSQLETETGSRKVLDVCFDEIDRCQPPMVVILGDRYGWIPSEGLVDAVAQRRRLRLDDLEKSVTALEIEYGALRDPVRTRNTLFYFRELDGGAPADYLPEDADHARRMAALKEKIHRLSGGNVRTYRLRWNGGGFDGIEAFADLLCSDLEDLLTDRWQRLERMSPLEKELYTHRSYGREKARAFRARQDFAREILDGIGAGQRLTIVKAPTGSGKSTLISHLAQELEAAGWQVLTLFSGLTPRSNTALGLVETMTGWLRQQLAAAGVHWDENFRADRLQAGQTTLKDIVDRSEETGQSRDSATRQQIRTLNELCIHCTKAGLKIALLIDAADQLLDDDARQKLAFLPTELSENLRFLMTCLPDLPVQGHPVTVLGPVQDRDRHRVISGILASHNRELSPEVTAAMVARPGSDNPLYLSFLVQRLLMMNHEDFDTIQRRGSGMDAITAHQLALLAAAPDTLDALSAALMDAASRRIGGTMVTRVLELLAASRHGLRVDDLSALLGRDFNQLDFAHFISYMNDCFLLREDGSYDFSHKSIREGLAARRDLRECHKALADHLLGLSADDPLRRKELAWHLIAADRKTDFADCVCAADEELLAVMAQDVYEATLSDGGAWVKDLIGAWEPADMAIPLIRFLYGDFAACATGRFAECGVLTDVLMVFVRKVLARFNASRQPADADLVVRTFYAAAKVHLLLGTDDALSTARILLSEAEKLLKQMVDVDLGRVYIELLAQACELHGQALGDSMEAAKKQEDAVGWYRNYHETDPTDQSARGLARQYMSLALRYNGVFYCDPDKARTHALQAVEIFQNLREKDPSARSDLDLADAMLNLLHIFGDMAYTMQNLLNISDNQQWQTLLEKDLPTEILDLLQQTAQQENSLTVQAKMAACHSKAVPYYKGLAMFAAHQVQKANGDKEDDPAVEQTYLERLPQAVRHGEKAVALYEAIRAELPSVENRRNLAAAWENLADLYRDQKDPALLPEIARCNRAALDLRDALYRDQGQEEDGFAMIYRADALSRDLETLGRTEEAVQIEKTYGNHPAKDLLEERRHAFSELLEIFRHMDAYWVDLIPTKLIIYIYDRCSLEYDFRMTKPIGEEKLREETLRFLNKVNRYYWEPAKQAKETNP